WPREWSSDVCSSVLSGAWRNLPVASPVRNRIGVALPHRLATSRACRRYRRRASYSSTPRFSALLAETDRLTDPLEHTFLFLSARSEERRVGKECGAV